MQKWSEEGMNLETDEALSVTMPRYATRYLNEAQYLALTGLSNSHPY